jgi:hypothetical protein
MAIELHLKNSTYKSQLLIEQTAPTVITNGVHLSPARCSRRGLSEALQMNKLKQTKTI